VSKGYTMAYFIREIKKCKRTDSPSDIIVKLCGRAPVKELALDYWLEFKIYMIAFGYGVYSGYGKTPKQRLLNVFRFRKKHGFVP